MWRWGWSLTFAAKDIQHLIMATPSLCKGTLTLARVQVEHGLSSTQHYAGAATGADDIIKHLGGWAGVHSRALAPTGRGIQILSKGAG